MTFSWCDVHTQLFSLKIAGVEQILSMQQPLTVWAVSGADAKRLREERLASWRVTGKGPCNRSAMAEAGKGRGKALCQEALARRAIRFDHRW